MIKHSLDSQNPLGQITLSAEKHKRVERNTDAGQMFLVRGRKLLQACLLFPGLKLISIFSPSLSASSWRLKIAWWWNLWIPSSKTLASPPVWGSWGLVLQIWPHSDPSWRRAGRLHVPAKQHVPMPRVLQMTEPLRRKHASQWVASVDNFSDRLWSNFIPGTAQLGAGAAILGWQPLLREMIR